MRAAGVLSTDNRLQQFGLLCITEDKSALDKCGSRILKKGFKVNMANVNYPMLTAPC